MTLKILSHSSSVRWPKFNLRPMFDQRYSVNDIRSTIFGQRYSVNDIRSSIFGQRYSVNNIQSTIFGRFADEVGQSV